MDYGNAVLAGLPAYLFHRLQTVMNAAARLIYGRPHLRRTHQPPLDPSSGESTVQDGRAHVKGHSLELRRM